MKKKTAKPDRHYLREIKVWIASEESRCKANFGSAKRYREDARDVLRAAVLLEKAAKIVQERLERVKRDHKKYLAQFKRK